MNLEKVKAEMEALNSRLEAEKTSPDEKRLAELKAAVEAEEKRLNSKAYKSALKKIDELANDAEARKMAIHKTIDELMDEFQAWEDVCNQHKKLANQHRIEARNLYMDEFGKLVKVQTELKHWKKSKKMWEAHKQAGLARPVHTKKLIGSSEREKMLRERYPMK